MLKTDYIVKVNQVVDIGQAMTFEDTTQERLQRAEKFTRFCAKALVGLTPRCNMWIGRRFFICKCCPPFTFYLPEQLCAVLVARLAGESTSVDDECSILWVPLNNARVKLELVVHIRSFCEVPAGFRQGLLRSPTCGTYPQGLTWDTSCPVLFLILIAMQDILRGVVITVQFSPTVRARVPSHTEAFLDNAST